MVLNPAGGGAAAPAAGMAAPARGAARPGGANVRAMKDHLERYLEMLGLPPGASLDEVNTAYYMVVKGFPDNPTEEDEARMQELKRAYDILRRAYVPPVRKPLQVLFDRRLMLPLMTVAALLLAGTLAYMNRGTIRLKMTHYEPGAVLRLKSAAVPYGTVVGYEPAHRFPAGAPGAAYAIRLDGRQETVWVSERLVENGMVPAAE